MTEKAVLISRSARSKYHFRMTEEKALPRGGEAHETIRLGNYSKGTGQSRSVSHSQSGGHHSIC